MVHICFMPVTRIHSDRTRLPDYLRSVLDYWSLIGIFAWQEIRAQYAQTYLGVLWAVLRPGIILSVFTVLFHYLLNVSTGVPYVLFAFTGMIAWNFFSQIASTASTSIVDRQDLIRKMYFPRIILPLTKVVIAGVETSISFLMLGALMLLLGWHLHWQVVLLPVFILANIICGLLVALWMIVLNGRYRDLNQIVMPLLSIGVWFTPVFFPITIIPQQFQFLLYLNPMAAVIAGYRYALLGDTLPSAYHWLTLLICTLALLAAIPALVRLEDEIADYA